MIDDTLSHRARVAAVQLMIAGQSEHQAAVVRLANEYERLLAVMAHLRGVIAAEVDAKGGG